MDPSVTMSKNTLMKRRQCKNIMKKPWESNESQREVPIEKEERERITEKEEND